MGNVGKRYLIGNVKKFYRKFVHGGSVSWAAGSLGVRFPFCIEMVKKGAPSRTPPEDVIKTQAEAFLKFTETVAINAMQVQRS